MRFTWSKRRAFLAGALLILLTNAIALGGVTYNRGGQPTSTLVLTEREIGVSYRGRWFDEDNSGIDLALHWRVLPKQDESSSVRYYSWNNELHWLDDEAKRQLGYAAPERTAYDQGTRGWDPREREAFVVLEYDGNAHRLALDLARKNLEHERALANANPDEKEIQERFRAAQEQMRREESQESRLFVVDVGVDPDELRARYPDRSRYAVVPARLDAYLSGPPHDRRVVVRVVELSVETISVPHAFRKAVEPFLPDVPTYSYPYERRAPRFAVAVNWGRRFEPWVVEFRPLEP
jgi:hypothetical protein